MRITRIGGITAGSNDALVSPDKVETLVYAGAAISVGSPVIVHFANATAALRAKTVIASTTAGAEAIIGVYEGTGRGAATTTKLSDTTTTGTGNDALSGEIVWITVFGEALVRTDGGTTDVAAGDALTGAVTAAALARAPSATVTAAVTTALIVSYGYTAAAVALEATTSATIYLCRTYVRYM